MGRVWVLHFPPQAPFPPLLGVPSQMWVSPKGACRSCPKGGCHLAVVVGPWRRSAVFAVPVKLPLAPVLENSPQPATIFILLKKMAGLGWQREMRHRFKVKLQ